MANTARALIRRCRRYIFMARDRLSREEILVTPAQCSGKCIAYTRCLHGRTTIRITGIVLSDLALGYIQHFSVQIADLYSGYNQLTV